MSKLIELTGLDGTKVWVDVESIRVFKYIKNGDLGSVIKVNYSGEVLFTYEHPEKLLSRMPCKEIFTKFTLRSNDPVWINTKLISGIRKAITPNEPGTEIIVGGLYQHVVDNIDYVRDAVESI